MGSAHIPRPSVDEVARWLLATPPSTVDSMLLAAEAAYEQLRARLVVSLGELGFETLWARAVHVAVRRVAPSAPVPIAPQPPTLRVLVSQSDPDQRSALLLGVFASFFQILVTFIGEPLMFRIIDQLWPTFCGYTADRTQPKESDHDDV